MKNLSPFILLAVFLLVSIGVQAQTVSIKDDNPQIFMRYLDCSEQLFYIEGTAKSHELMHYNKSGEPVWRKINTTYDVYCPALDESFKFTVIFKSNIRGLHNPWRYEYHYTAVGDKGSRVIVLVKSTTHYRPYSKIMEISLKCL